MKPFEDGVPSFDGEEGTIERLAPAATSLKESREQAPDDVALPPTNFAKVEKSLASLGFFTPSSRRLRNAKVKKITFTREVDGKRVEVTAEIVPSVKSGLPITADQDKYLALHEIITNIMRSEGRVENPIRFKSADLIRLLKNDPTAGKNYKEIYEWLDVMSTTTIISNGVVYLAGQKRYVRDTFHVFDRVVSAGKEFADGTIADANYVWLSSWQLDNINNKYLLPIDLESYRQLKNHIAKALVPLLQIWLFASHKAGSFEKRYDELCEILDVTKHGAPSLIKRQLTPSLDELALHGYLEKWRIEKTSDGKAYKVILFHGAKFHRDRRKRIEQTQSKSSEPIIVAQSEPADEPSLLELGRLESTSPEPAPVQKVREKKRTTKSDPVHMREEQEVVREPEPVVENTPSDLQSALVDELARRGLMPSSAIKLLTAIEPNRLEGVRDYIEYWDAVKATKDVGPGLLHDLIKKGGSLPPTFVSSRAREVQRQAEERRNRLVQAKQSLEVAYDQYREDVLDRYIENELPKDEYERLYAAYKQEMAKQGGIFAEMQHSATFNLMVKGAIRAEIRKRVHSMPFDEFCRREARSILAVYNIDPAELGIVSIPPRQPEAASQGGEVDAPFSSPQHQEVAPAPIIDPIPPQTESGTDLSTSTPSEPPN